MKCTKCEKCNHKVSQCTAAVAPNMYKRDWTRCAKSSHEDDLCIIHHRLKREMGRVKLWKEYQSELKLKQKHAYL